MNVNEHESDQILHLDTLMERNSTFIAILHVTVTVVSSSTIRITHTLE